MPKGVKKKPPTWAELESSVQLELMEIVDRPDTRAYPRAQEAYTWLMARLEKPRRLYPHERMGEDLPPQPGLPDFRNGTWCRRSIDGRFLPKVSTISSMPLMQKERAKRKYKQKTEVRRNISKGVKKAIAEGRFITGFMRMKMEREKNGTPWPTGIKGEGKKWKSPWFVERGIKPKKGGSGLKGR